MGLALKRLWLRVRLLGDRPRALVAAATLWHASGLFEDARAYAEQAVNRLRTSDMDDAERRRLLSEAALAGCWSALKLYHASTHASERDWLANDILRWCQILIDNDPTLLEAVVLHDARLGGLQPRVRSLLDAAQRRGVDVLMGRGRAA